MKRCPACSRVYDDLTLRFCLDDGTELVQKSETAPPTLAFPTSETPQSTIEAFQPPPPPPYLADRGKPPRRGLRLAVWILAIGLIVAIVTGGIFVVGRLRKDRLTWYLVMEVDPGAADRAKATQQIRTVIERRLNSAGIGKYLVQLQGDSSTGRIIVKLPELENPERIKQLVSTQGKLEFVHVISPTSPSPVQTYDTKEAALASIKSAAAGEANRRVLPYSDREAAGLTKWVVVESPAIVDGSSIRNASAVPGYVNGNYQIVFTLNSDGASKFGAWTGANINEYLGVALNDEVKSTAFIKSQIFDQGEISGNFTKEAAMDLALTLKSGALAAPVKLIEEGIIK